jgi:hypothetical protein
MMGRRKKAPVNIRIVQDIVQFRGRCMKFFGKTLAKVKVVFNKYLTFLMGSEESKYMASRKMGSPSLTTTIGTTSSSDSTPRSPVDPASAPVDPIRMWLLNSNGKRQS